MSPVSQPASRTRSTTSRTSSNLKVTCRRPGRFAARPALERRRKVSGSRVLLDRGASRCRDRAPGPRALTALCQAASMWLRARSVNVWPDCVSIGHLRQVSYRVELHLQQVILGKARQRTISLRVQHRQCQVRCRRFVGKAFHFDSLTRKYADRSDRRSEATRRRSHSERK